MFVLGATATGKTRLSIEIATRISGEIINSDKIQVFKGLDIATNKVSEKERKGIPHHLLAFLHPEDDFTPEDFCKRTLEAIDKITAKGNLPIVVGGSNTYIEALVEDPEIKFRAKFDCLFLWTDASLPVHYEYVGKRVDKMVEAGLVEEAREMFRPGADYNKGVRRAIGAPELDEYFQFEQLMKDDDEETKQLLLKNAIQEIKDNTCKLVDKQLEKIHRLRNEVGWEMHRFDATRVLETRGEESEIAWKQQVLNPGMQIVEEFLKNGAKIHHEETKVSAANKKYD